MNKIYIVQHCQSEHHVNDLTGGWTDTPLTELGLIQAQKVAHELKILGVNKRASIYTSDLKRAKMTAEVISEYFGLELVSDESLREINNGEAKDKTKQWASENMLLNSEELVLDKPFWNGAETSFDIYNRMKSVYNKYLKDIKNDVVIVSHGVAISYLLAVYLNIDINNIKDSILAGNAGGITVLTRSRLNQNRVKHFNIINHLRNI